MKKKYKISILISILFISLVAMFSLLMYLNYSEVDVMLFLISSVSLSISFIALIISLNTYYSIDAVNKVTRMEGNLLENNSYTLSLPELLSTYKETNPNELADKLFTDLKNRFSKQSKTAIEFTDHLQHFVDVLVFFPAIFNSKSTGKNYNVRTDEILKIMKTTHENLKELVSTGDFIQVDEIIKLIEGVIAYQKFYEQKNLNPSVELLKVRGSLLKNNVTRTVYYNYLGLLYNKKVLVKIREALKLEDIDLLEKDNAKYIFDKLTYATNLEKESIRIFLIESIRSFEKAQSSADNDIMWKAYISYNLARSQFYLECLEPEKQTEWLNTLSSAVSSRNKLNMIVSEILPEDQTHLSNHYVYQEQLARLVRMNLLYATGQIENEISDTFNTLTISDGLRLEYAVLDNYLNSWEL